MALCWTVPHCIIWNTREKKIAVDISSSLLECTYKELNPLLYSLITFFFWYHVRHTGRDQELFKEAARMHVHGGWTHESLLNMFCSVMHWWDWVHNNVRWSLNPVNWSGITPCRISTPDPHPGFIVFCARSF